MSDSNNSPSPLRQRMIEDMTMRKLSQKTQKSYIRHVCELGEHLGYSPHKATAEDLCLYQLHMVQSGQSSGSINARLCGLRFFFFAHFATTCPIPLFPSRTATAPASVINTGLE